MKKKDLTIADLKVQSFVTSMNNETANTVKGREGSFGQSFEEGCDTVDGFNNQPALCRNTVYPDQSICNPACVTNVAWFCNL